MRQYGSLKEFLILFGDLHEAHSHAEGVFFRVNAVHVRPNDLADETDGLTIRRDDGHAEIFVHAEGFIASHIDPAQGDVSYLALDGAAL
jgi:hypothetical protein